ncbi:high mobility group nucleosome-binding domain-containing protein 5-like [Pseudorasbora parva]|uniref:high mobility group nucleosome-binding domain-containing protein 5-like n=1 Tax=Pseudorasbora parva TaxID=51549 RepID=UPI00351DCB90
MTHHLEQLRETEEEPGPRSLQKVARWLGGVVLPAAPSPTVGWKLYGSARRWLCDSLDILRNHYTSVQKEALEGLRAIDREEGTRALEVAARWARRNLKNLQEKTVQEAMKGIKQLWKEEEEKEGGEGRAQEHITVVRPITAISGTTGGEGAQEGGKEPGQEEEGRREGSRGDVRPGFQGSEGGLGGREPGGGRESEEELEGESGREDTDGIGGGEGEDVIWVTTEGGVGGKQGEGEIGRVTTQEIAVGPEDEDVIWVTRDEVGGSSESTGGLGDPAQGKRKRGREEEGRRGRPQGGRGKRIYGWN